MLPARVRLGLTPVIGPLASRGETFVVRYTLPEKPFRLVAATVTVPLELRTRASPVGFALMLKL